MNALVRSVAVALTAGVALVAVPASAQDPAPKPTRFVAALPGSVSGGSSGFALPGDLVVKKFRGDKAKGKESLTTVVATLQRLKAKGHDIASSIVIKGKVYVVKGIPTIMDDGTVKVRIAQVRGSRSIVVPRVSSKYYATSCPAGYYRANVDSFGNPICEPLGT